MRVLHVLRRLEPGGIECWLERLLAAWQGPSRPEFHFALECADFGSLAPRLEALGARLHHCPAPHQPWEAATALRRILREEGPFQAIHCHTHYASPFGLAVAAQCRVPVRVAHSHADFRATAANWARRRYATVAREALSWLANVKVAVSRAASEDLFGGGLGARILPCGIDGEKFLRAAGRRDASRFTLVHAGRLVPEKNHRWLLDLSMELRRRVPELRVWLIGEGPLRGELEREIARRDLAGCVELWGARADVADLMAAADLFVFPSLAEGLGLAAVEAQAVGLPVLAAAHLPEEIDWLPGAVHRLALDVPIGEWADTALALRAYPPLPLAVREERLAQSQFSMQSNIRALEQIYAG